MGWCVFSEQASEISTFVEMKYDHGNPITTNDEQIFSATILEKLNKIDEENNTGCINKYNTCFMMV